MHFIGTKNFALDSAVVEVQELSDPTYFVNDIRISHGITSTITKLIDFKVFFTFLFATVFIQMNQNVNS